MEKIKNIKIGDTIIKSKVELTEDKLMVQFKVGECICSGLFKKCKFCGTWTVRENGICPKCENLVKSLMKTADKEAKKENATEVAKKEKTPNKIEKGDDVQTIINRIKHRFDECGVKCPRCGSNQIQVVRKNFSFLRGFATNAVERVCVNCKHRF